MIRRGFSPPSPSSLLPPSRSQAGSAPQRARLGMVITQSDIASQIGFQVIQSGGNAVDAAVATAFALAVTHPTAGNIGGGGFLVFRPASGRADVVRLPRGRRRRGSIAEMWLKDGKYDSELHHNSHLVGRRARHGRRPPPGVEGTRAASRGRSWSQPAVALARDGFVVSRRPGALARAACSTTSRSIPASLAQFSKNGMPYEAGEILKQPDLARTLERIADQGPAGFYEGETAALIEKEMKAQRRPHHARRPQELPGEEARADQGHLSRLRGHRHAAAQLRRHRGRRRC